MLITRAHIRQYARNIAREKSLKNKFKTLKVRKNIHNEKSYLKYQKNFFRGKQNA